MSDLVPAAATGSRAAALRALRDRLAKEIDDTNSARDVAALSRQLTDVLQQLDGLPGERETSAADELAAKRAKRAEGA